MPESLLRALNHSAPAIAATIADASDPLVPLFWVSDRFSQLTGWTSVDLQGKSLKDLAPVLEQHRISDLVRGAIANTTPITQRVSLALRDGALLPHEVTLEAVRDGSRRPVFVLATHRLDTTVSEEATRAAHELLLTTLSAYRQDLYFARLLKGHVAERILRSLFSGVVAVDRHSTVIYANKAAMALTERSATDILGKPLAEVLGETAEKLAHEKAGSEAHFDAAFVTLRGHRRDVGFNVVRMVAAHDWDIQSVFLFRDIGDRRQYEIEMRRVKGLTALGQMAAGFAHEVRNPLAALRSLNECLLMELPQEDPRAEYAKRMVGLVRRIESLVDHSLRYARPRPPNLTPTDVSRVLHGAMESLAPRLRLEREIRVTSRIKSPTLVMIDEMQMVQVLVNLIENALDSAGGTEHVWLEIDQTEVSSKELIRISVIDDGPGLDDATMQLAFDPFFTTKSKGTGLGLAVAQRLMLDNGGHLIAKSDPAVRTEFSMIMPLAQ